MMKVVWMFRAIEMVTEKRARGTLTVCQGDEDERSWWRAIFVPDGGERFEVERPSISFRGEHGHVELPEADSQESRELGKVSALYMEPSPSYPNTVAFALYSRMPATGAQAVTTQVSIAVSPAVRSG